MAHLLINYIDQNNELSQRVFEDLTNESEMRRLARQRRFKERVDVYRNDYLHLIRKYGADKFYSQPETKEEILRAATTENNLTIQVVNATAISYSRGAQRKFDKLRKRDQKIYQRLLDESELKTEAQTWERWATAVNLVFIIPERFEDELYGNRIRYNMILPHLADVILRPGTDDVVDILFYSIEDQSIVIDNKASTYNRVAVDALAYYYFKNNKLLAIVEHGLGVNPAVVLRTERQDPGDFWSISRNQDLFDATIGNSLKQAIMQLVRKEFMGKLIHMDLPSPDSVPSQQVRDHHGLLITSQQGGAQNIGNKTSINVLDMNVPITDFVADQNNSSRLVKEARGIYVGDGSLSDLSEKRRRENLELLREAKKPFLQRAEKELAFKIAAVAKYHMKINLDPREVWEAFRIEFPELDPLSGLGEMIDNSFKLIQGGVWTEADLVMTMEDIGRDEARERVILNIEEQAGFDEMRAKRQLKKNFVDRTMTVAQEQGQEGGLQKANNEEITKGE